MAVDKQSKPLIVKPGGRIGARQVLLITAILFAAAIVVVMSVAPTAPSPLIDPGKKRLVDEAHEEFAVPSDYALTEYSTMPSKIATDALDSLDPTSVRVAICPEREAGCPPGGTPRLFYLDHVVQYGVDGAPDIYDFVFRRRDDASASASQQELRYRTWDGGGFAALVVRPTDWTDGMRRNGVATLPDFKNTALGEFLYTHHTDGDLLTWGNVSGVARTCIGYCPAPTPDLGDRLQSGLQTAIAYLETGRGRNAILAICAIISALAAIFTLLLKGAEFALAKKQGETGVADSTEMERTHGGRATHNPTSVSRKRSSR